MTWNTIYRHMDDQDRLEKHEVNITARKYGLVDMIKIPLRCAPLSAVLMAVQSLIGGVVPAIQVIVTARFIDHAMGVLQGSMEITQIYLPLLGLLGLLAYQWLFYALIKFSQIRTELGLQRRFRTAVTDKRARLAYHHIENPDSWDLISRVAGGAQGNIMSGYSNLLTIGAGALQVGGLFLLLARQVWWAALLILSFAIPLFALSMKSGRSIYEANREVSKYRRRYQYLSQVLTGREAVDERLLFGYGEKLNDTWHERYEQAYQMEFSTRRRWFVRMKAGSVLTAIASMLAVLVLLGPVLAGTITVGMFISLVNAILGIVHLMSWQFTNCIDQLAGNREYLADLTKFANLEETADAQAVPAESIPVFESLEFRGVSFRYPGTERLILNNLSFTVEAGRHYALVGINGAGKSTIAKLIIGLYDNFEGEILLNGRSLREYTQSQLKALVNMVYQDFARYYVPMRDNIAIGRARLLGSRDSDAEIEQAAASVGLTDVIARLPQGLDTPLGRILHDGQELSGGEWQRVAMARAVFNPAPFTILDEPTAALDPISESRLYHEFEWISRGKTTIFISHRLGSTKLADEILVIDEGHVAEQGTHEELMQGQGIYAKMYDSQRGWYS